MTCSMGFPMYILFKKSESFYIIISKRIYLGEIMSEEKITYDDVRQYEKFFTLTPSFLLERWAKKNTNLVSKFESKIESFLNRMDDNKRNKLHAVLNSDIDELQLIMKEAHERTNKKQYKILANPKYKQFIEENLKEIEKMV